MAQIGGMAKDPVVVQQLLAEAHRQTMVQRAEIENHQQTLQREMVHLNSEIRQALSESADGAAEATKRLAALKKRLRQAEVAWVS